MKFLPAMVKGKGAEASTKEVAAHVE